MKGASRACGLALAILRLAIRTDTKCQRVYS